MRYKYSHWDLVFLGLLGLLIYLNARSVALLDHLAALLTFAGSYLIFRLIDSIFLAQKPAKYGWMTNVGGGMAVFVALAHFENDLWATGFQLGNFVIVLMGALYTYLAWLLRVTPVDRIPWSYPRPGSSAAKLAVARALAASLFVSGIVIIILAFLPGNWSHLSIAPAMLGPVMGIFFGATRAPILNRK